MVTARRLSRNCLLTCCLFTAPAGADCYKSPCYYEDFSPAGMPWAAPVERNYEEVFKLYRYYSVRHLDPAGDRLEVSEYRKGEIAAVTRYLRDDGTGALLVDQQVVTPDAGDLYRAHCAACHGADRLGGTAPALLPGNLGRLKQADGAEVIRAGRTATQMPPFGQLLSPGQIDVLVDYIYTPPEVTPAWVVADIRDSHVVHHATGSLPQQPVFTADPLNLFLVVEKGDHHVTVLDGDRFVPIHRFRSRFALHGGLKYSPDGRFAYLASRDGWVSKFDLYSLQTVAEIRAGINTRNVAVSGDGKTVLVGNYLPTSLVLLDADDLSLIRVIDVCDDDGRQSRISAVYQAAPRGSFIAALKDIPEVWEVSASAPDYPIRRIRLDRVLDDFFFDDAYSLLIGADRAEAGGQVIALDDGRQIARLSLQGMPHLGSGITWEYHGSPVVATPDLKSGKVSIIDTRSWETIREIETLGPGFFMRSHENTPYAWVDVFFGPNRDAMHVIDKQTLQLVRTLRPEPGKTSAHVEFTRDGRHALVSLWEDDGALIVYDAQSLEEVRRIPMRKPSGKYNVYNKISRSSGTSH